MSFTGTPRRVSTDDVVLSVLTDIIEDDELSRCRTRGGRSVGASWFSEFSSLSRRARLREVAAAFKLTRLCWRVTVREGKALAVEDIAGEAAREKREEPPVALEDAVAVAGVTDAGEGRFLTMTGG